MIKEPVELAAKLTAVPVLKYLTGEMIGADYCHDE